MPTAVPLGGERLHIPSLTCLPDNFKGRILCLCLVWFLIFFFLIINFHPPSPQLKIEYVVITENMSNAEHKKRKKIKITYNHFTQI